MFTLYPILGSMIKWWNPKIKSNKLPSRLVYVGVGLSLSNQTLYTVVRSKGLL